MQTWLLACTCAHVLPLGRTGARVAILPRVHHRRPSRVFCRKWGPLMHVALHSLSRLLHVSLRFIRGMLLIHTRFPLPAPQLAFPHLQKEMHAGVLGPSRLQHQGCSSGWWRDRAGGVRSPELGRSGCVRVTPQGGCDPCLQSG